MERQSNAPETTQSLPKWDGDPLAPWRGVRACFAVKTCKVCGKEMRPYILKTGIHAGQPESEKLFLLRECCGKSCAKKLKNPMHSEASREKMVGTLKRIGHKPTVRGGNGKGLTNIQAKMLDVLGTGWLAEYAEKTHKSPAQGYPYSYKIDIANPILGIAIELDGASHQSAKRRAQDEKKDGLLRSLGWKVLRMSNTQAEYVFTTSESKLILHILQTAH